MRAFNKNLIFLLLIFLYSCVAKPETKEIIYQIDSIGQFKNYLKGRWVKADQKKETKYFYTFDFSSTYSGVFQDLQETNEKGLYKTFTCAPAFRITEKQGTFYLNFVSMFEKSNFQEPFKIVSISNKKLVLTNKGGKVIYNKKED